MKINLLNFQKNFSRKKLIRSLLIIVAWLGLSMNAKAQMTPFQAVEKMTCGINIGQTMDLEYEPTRKIQSYYFSDFKTAGFDFVRIPIRWDKHTGTTYPYTIDAAWLDRVEQVVDWSLGQGLITIINTHHDYWILSNNNPTANDIARFKAIWTQIANRFKNKSEKLLFEIANEPAIAVNLCDNLNAYAIPIIRQTNPTRNIVFGSSGTQMSTLKQAVIPNDPYLIATFHSYIPWPFCGEGIGTWGSTAEITQIEGIMAEAAAWSEAHNIPMILGEYSARVECEVNARAKWFTVHTEKARRLNIAPCVWMDFGWFTLYYDTNVEANKWTTQSKNVIVAKYHEPAEALTVSNNQLTWNNRDADYQSITIERKSGSGSYQTIATLTGSAETYLDGTAVAGTTYTYRVVSKLSTGTLAYSFPSKSGTTTLPIATISSPVNNTAINVNTAVTISAIATNGGGTISKVEFFAGATLIGTDTNSPYSINWTPTTSGTYAITAKATDNSGASTTSAASNLIVNAVVVYAPITGVIQAEAYSAMFGIQTETTTDTGGGLDVGYTNAGDWMDYAVNVQTAGAYTVSFRVASLVTTGSIQLRNSAGTTLATLTQGSTGGWQTWVTKSVAATLAAGNQTLRIYYSGAGLNINWIQFAKANTPPTVALTAPANNTSVYVNTAVTASADATDTDGTVSKVDFYAGTTLIGTATSSPYSISWTPTTIGTFAITAKATDNGGSSTTSTAANLNVTSATTTVTLNPTADAYVRGGTYAAINYGTTVDLYVKSAPETDGLYTRKAYLKFSVAGMTGVQNAVVRLYAGTVAAFSVKVNETTDAWTETAINWNNAPAAGTLIATKAITAAGVYYEWNVTSFVQSQAAGDGVVSLVFSDAATTNAQIIFSSKEATANKPQLVVTSSNILKSVDVSAEFQVITNKELKIYPNPVSDELQIQNADQNSTIEIFNLSGKLVLTKKFDVDNNTLNVGSLKAGMYILKASESNRTLLVKFIKK
jgi:hypothetical protein